MQTNVFFTSTTSKDSRNFTNKNSVYMFYDDFIIQYYLKKVHLNPAALSPAPICRRGGESEPTSCRMLLRHLST